MAGQDRAARRPEHGLRARVRRRARRSARRAGATPDAPISTSTCAAGAGELAGTGYAGIADTLCHNGGDVAATLGGATGWLTTSAPIHPGEQFTLEFMIWDAGDGILDSSVLLDHFQWIGQSAGSPGTQPAQ